MVNMRRVDSFNMESFKAAVEKWRQDALNYKSQAIQNFRDLWDMVFFSREEMNPLAMAETITSISKN